MPAPGPYQTVLSIFQSFRSGFRLLDGRDVDQMTKILFTATSGLTANPGGGQANAVQLQSGLNEVDVVATAADSVKLPAAIAGQTIRVFNNGANSLQVFGLATDQIVAAGSRTGAGVTGLVGVALASAAGCDFTCYVTSTWKQHTF